MSDLLPHDEVEAGSGGYPSGLPVFKGEAWEDHVNAWMLVSEQIENYRWQLAAIAASLHKRYGENVAGKFASEVGVSAETVRRYARAYRAFSKENNENAQRSPILTLTHHAIAARFADPQKAIEEAEDEQLSTRQMEVRAEAEVLPEAERRAVIRIADERKMTQAETRNLVRSRLASPDTERVWDESALVDSGLPAGEVVREGSEESVPGIRRRVPPRSVEAAADRILEVCPHCGAPSSSWVYPVTERRPQSEPSGE